MCPAVQHNGAGTVKISNFFASDFGKLYRACGNCSKSYERHVTVDNVSGIPKDHMVKLLIHG
jgi:pectate lyase